MFTPQRLLVWDSFQCHISTDTKTALKKIKVQQAVVPGGYTGFNQAPDVCWNKPFKVGYAKSYAEWFKAGNQEFTAGGNPKSAPLANIIG